MDDTGGLRQRQVYPPNLCCLWPTVAVMLEVCTPVVSRVLEKEAEAIGCVSRFHIRGFDSCW